MKPKTEVAVKKPAFDGRSPYYNTLEKIMMAVAATSIYGIYDRWLRSLRVLYNMVAPFIDGTAGKAIKEKLESAKQEYRLMQSHNLKDAAYQKAYYLHQQQLDEYLLEAHEDIFQAARDLLLTTKATDAEDFDAEKFLRDSDL